MRPGEAVKCILKEKGLTQTWLARQMGYRWPSGLTNITNREYMSVSLLVDICRALGYCVTIQPLGKKKTKGQYVITRRNEDESIPDDLWDEVEEGEIWFTVTDESVQ